MILDTAKAFQTLIVGAIGFLGVIATLLTNAWLARRQHSRQVEHDATVLRVSLRAELEAVAEAYRDRIAMLEAWKPNQYGSMLVPLDAMTDVYKSMIGRLGLLSRTEVRAVLRAYLLIQQMPDRIKVLGGNQTAEPGFTRVGAPELAALRTLHENYLADIDGAIAAISD